MASVVDICNSALNQIGASNIIALTEDSKAARICNQRYEFIRDGVFRSHPWNSLITRQTLASDATAPSFTYSNQFTLPTDPFCLRVLKLSDPEIKFEIEGRKILCDESTLNVVFVGKITDPNQYDTLLTETIVAALSADIAYPLSGSITLAAQFATLYREKLKEARFVDATEGNTTNTSSIADSEVLAANTFINARL
tara:strand:+ start:247 stop:837 length:591 start_codon:yes stop_codon:yes gene_type:complete